MVPKDVVEKQTYSIISYLLDDEHIQSGFRDADCQIETDGPEQSDDKFDPVLIADKLRAVADEMMNDDKFKAALGKLQQAAAEEATEAMEAAFSQSVEALCRAPVSQKGEVVAEMQLIKASVALGLYVKKKAPELKHSVRGAMNAFLNNRIGDWVAQQGGWVSTC
ncbi:bcl-2-like protein 15, partial [Centroberyx affinis]|uniref:bcl-2-like protein 15 n=1 Tax=Centroberyx affinis TaxID=166261 RepID=UPI003A5BE0E5